MKCDRTIYKAPLGRENEFHLLMCKPPTCKDLEMLQRFMDFLKEIAEQDEADSWAYEI